MSNSWSRQLGNVLADGNESGLIGAWNMWLQNGAVPDETGVNDGTVVGSLHGEYQSLGRSLRYDGASYLNIGNDSSLQISGGSITLSFFCRFNSITGFQGLVSKGNTTSDQNYHLRIDDGKIEFYFRDSTDSTNVQYQTTPVDPVIADRILHIVLTHTFGDNTSTKVYVNGDVIDGVFITGTGNELPLPNTTDDATIGNRGVPDSYFDGNIFSVKFFNIYQDQDWVTREYQRGRSSMWLTKYGVDISAAAVTGGPLENSSFRVESGSHKISSYSIGGVSAKVIECVTAGDVSMLAGHFHNNSIDSAFGEYDCWIEKASGHTTKLGFMCQNRNTTANGYGMQILTDGTTTIEEWGIGSVVTGGSLTAGTLARLQMRRRAYDSRFEGLIDGTSFGTGTDTTIDESFYTVFSLGVGDKIVLADRNGGHAFVKRLMA
jgi:hypothetical protein